MSHALIKLSHLLLHMSAFMIKSKRYKFICYGDCRDHSLEKLFDIRNDPNELVNLAVNTKYSDKVWQLRRVLVRDFVRPDLVSNKVKKYNLDSFRSYKNKFNNNDSFWKNLSELRWWKDFGRDPNDNVLKIKKWLKADSF